MNCLYLASYLFLHLRLHVYSMRCIAKCRFSSIQIQLYAETAVSIAHDTHTRLGESVGMIRYQSIAIYLYLHLHLHIYSMRDIARCRFRFQVRVRGRGLTQSVGRMSCLSRNIYLYLHLHIHLFTMRYIARCRFSSIQIQIHVDQQTISLRLA